MIQRTYLVVMPSEPGALDIVVEGPVGSSSAPVKAAAGGTTPPVGWNGVDGQYFEWRARTLRFESLFGGTGFVPRLRLSFGLAITGNSEVLPIAKLSASLLGTLSAAFAGLTLADPAYGPVIRLTNTVNTASNLYVVSFTVSEVKDEPHAPAGM